MNIQFTKMHGLGNDFVVIDNMNGKISLSTEQIVFLCDRHRGVGADGVILVESSDKADCYMNYYNSDGTMAEMCGNGVRCVAKFLQEEILPKEAKGQTIFHISTRAGVKEIKYEDGGTFSVNMGKPVFSHKDFPENSIELEGLMLDCVSVGNPHAVAFVNNIQDFDLKEFGPKIEINSHFPNKINFHLVEEVSQNELKVATWERGCGITMACGTGATGVYAVLRKHRNAPKELTINLPGGPLFFSENAEGDIIMRGPAESVFSSMIYVK